jgi:hypothetical protein
MFFFETLVCVQQTSFKQNFDFISCFAFHAVDRPRRSADVYAFDADCTSCQWSVEVEETKIFFRLREFVFMTSAWSSVSARCTCKACKACKAALLSRRQFFLPEFIQLIPKLPFCLTACLPAPPPSPPPCLPD